MNRKDHLNKMALQIAELSHEMLELAKQEYGPKAFIFVSDDEGISICDRSLEHPTRAESVKNQVVQSTSSSHCFDIGSW